MKTPSRPTNAWLLLAALVVAAPAPAHAQAAQPQVDISAADRQLQALYQGYSDWASKEFGYFEDASGETKPAAFLPRVDAATQLRRAEHLSGLLARLNAIDAALLSPDERVNAAVLRTVLEASIA